jgi:hypothetical protein
VNVEPLNLGHEEIIVGRDVQPEFFSLIRIHVFGTRSKKTGDEPVLAAAWM